MKQQMLFEEPQELHTRPHMGRQLPAGDHNATVELLAELMGRIVNPDRETPPCDHSASAEGPCDE